MKNDELLALREDYQKGLALVEKDYRDRRLDMERDYCLSVEKAYRSKLGQGMTTDVFISEYVSNLKSSPFWSPLA